MSLSVNSDSEAERTFSTVATSSNVTLAFLKPVTPQAGPPHSAPPHNDLVGGWVGLTD